MSRAWRTHRRGILGGHRNGICAPLRLSESFCSDVQESGLIGLPFLQGHSGFLMENGLQEGRTGAAASSEDDFSDPGER